MIGYELSLLYCMIYCCYALCTYIFGKGAFGFMMLSLGITYGVEVICLSGRVFCRLVFQVALVV
jgi:hypothetical protein